MIDVMKKLSEIAENYDNEDIQAGIVAAGKTHSVVAEETVQESAVKDMMQDVEEGMTKAEFAKKYPSMADQYDEIKQEIKDKMNESVNEAFDQVDRITDMEELNLYSEEEIKAAKSTSAEELKNRLIADIDYLMDKAGNSGFTANDHIADEMGDVFASMHLNADDATLSCYTAIRDLIDEDPAVVLQVGEKCLKILGGVGESMDKSVHEASVEEVHEDVESDETELDRMLYLGGVMGSSSNNIMIKENSEVPVQEDRKDDMISWVEKYENYIGRNGDSLPEGYVQWAMNSGITTDAMEQDEVDVMIKKYGEDKFEDDPMSFIDEMPITKAYMQELEQITGTDDIEDNAEMIRMFVESATNEATVAKVSDTAYSTGDAIMYKGKEIDLRRLDYDMQDVSDGIYQINAPAYYTDGTEIADGDYDDLYDLPELNDYIYQDYMSESVEEASVEEADNTDRSSVTLDMVAPALKKLHMEYKEKANEYHTAYAEMEADGMSDEEIMNADDDIVGYVNIDDIEDKIKAIEEVFKEGNFGEVNGNNIIAMASSGDTAMRELFMQELKYAIKDNHPEVYSKLFMYGIGESKNESVEEASVEEASVEVPVQELQDILQLAGFENYAEKIEEYANEPNEEYGDSEEQMVGLSGGLNGPKTHYPAAAGGDNPMNVKPLKVDDVYESFYTKYDKFIAELNNQNK